MFLHIGADEIVFLRDVVAIMDIERTTTSHTTRDFLKHCEEQGKVKTIGYDIPKSFIVTKINGKQTVYLSPISSATLYKRATRVAPKDRRN
ncbi:MAG: DUF370 domain-containing protein [Clostridia bacterium]|nr:DUF370 domain-containing protein [Clostridia bacterium]